MPNISNLNSTSTRDTLQQQSRTATLGANLEYRSRQQVYPQYNNFSWWASGPITTTRRTLGMPLSSAVDIGIFPASARIIYIASTSANDTAAGTGARTLTIVGLDANFEPLTESNITLNGQTPVTTTNQFLRVNRLFVDDSGSTNANEGDIYCSDSTDTFISGIPQNQVYLAMFSGENSDTWGQYTFKAHCSVHYVKGNFYTNATPDVPILIEERYVSPNFTGGRTDYTSGALWYTGNISYNYDGGGAIGATTDAMWIATSSTGIREGTVYYEMVEKDLVLDFDNSTFIGAPVPSGTG